jgi:cephalosporin hydroxylase
MPSARYEPTAGTAQKRSELWAFAGLLAHFEVATLVELGTQSGGASEYLARHLPNLRLVTVDLSERWYEPIDNSRVIRLIGDSHDRATLVRCLELLGGQPDAVFIDADHHHAAVKADLDLWWPQVRIMAALHDILINGSGQLWQEISRDHESIELLSRDQVSARAWYAKGGPDSGCGIGVLFK